jgi:hypothetical protein
MALAALVVPAMRHRTLLLAVLLQHSPSLADPTTEHQLLTAACVLSRASPFTVPRTPALPLSTAAALPPADQPPLAASLLHVYCVTRLAAHQPLTPALPCAIAAPPPPADKPPLGCAHDAYKLLLSNVPLSVAEADLAAVLRQYGHVVQLVLSPDNSGVSCS